MGSFHDAMSGASGTRGDGLAGNTAATGRLGELMGHAQSAYQRYMYRSHSQTSPTSAADERALDDSTDDIVAEANASVLSDSKP